MTTTATPRVTVTVTYTCRTCVDLTWTEPSSALEHSRQYPQHLVIAEADSITVTEPPPPPPPPPPNPRRSVLIPDIDSYVMRRLRDYAARTGLTVSWAAECAIDQGLRAMEFRGRGGRGRARQLTPARRLEISRMGVAARMAYAAQRAPRPDETGER